MAVTDIQPGSSADSRIDNLSVAGKSPAWRVLLPAGLTMLIGIGCAVAAFIAARDNQRREAMVTLEREADRRATALGEAVVRDMMFLESVGATNAIDNDGVSREEFKAFVTPLLSYCGDLQAVEWITRVAGSSRTEFERSVRREGLTNFSITERSAGPQGSPMKMLPAGERSEYFPVCYIEPVKGNEPALGFDVASDAARKRALDAARDSGQMRATGKITLVQEQDRHFGFLVFRPAYRRGVDPGDEASRRQNLEGFVLGVFRIGDLVTRAMRAASSNQYADLAVRLVDESAPAGEQFLWSSAGAASAGEPEAVPPGADPQAAGRDLDSLQVRRPINVAGRQWSLVLSAKPGFWPTTARVAPWAVLGAVLALTALLAGYLAVSAGKRARIEQLAGSLGRSNVDLRTSERNYRDLVESSSSMIVKLDREGRITFFNEFAERFFGFSKKEVIGRSIIGTILPEVESSGRDLRRMVTDLTADPATFEANVNENVTRDGKRVWVAWTNRAILGPDGQLAGTLSVGVDVTEKTRMEERLLQRQKMEAVGQLAGGVAHDFNNILTGISGFAQLALETVPPEHSAAEDMREIVQLSQRASNLTQQLLAFSRRQTIEPVVTSLNEAVTQTMRMLGRLLGEQIRLDFRPADNLPSVRIDPARLEQVLVNLAVNARDAMADGGQLVLTTSEFNVDEDCAKMIGLRPGPHVMLTVSDTGCGMDDETRGHIFEPFFTTKPKGQGTGLGLPIVYGIVQQHGGAIRVYSEPGRGTTFRVYLPATSDGRQPNADAALASRPPQAAGTETILVAEDEACVRTLIQRVLTRLGYTVFMAESADKAEELFAQHRGEVDLLLTDMVMPGRNGQKLYASLAAESAGLRVLYMSGYAEPIVARQAVLDPDSEFVAKPFTAAELAAKVRLTLDKEE